ncbi:MAG: hypothetical protein WCA89_01260 [Terracidiphilus sp.]|jgi:hypothetical protein
MSDDNSQNQNPAYSFQGSSPADELLEIARIHRREAKQLFDRADEAHAEDRQEEAKLLMDLAISRRDRAVEFEMAARGKGGDPIVAEILDSQEEMCVKYTPFSPSIMSKEELTLTAEEQSAAELAEGKKSTPSGRIARAVAWVGSWIA